MATYPQPNRMQITTYLVWVRHSMQESQPLLVHDEVMMAGAYWGLTQYLPTTYYLIGSRSSEKQLRLHRRYLDHTCASHTCHCRMQHPREFASQQYGSHTGSTNARLRRCCSQAQAQQNPRPAYPDPGCSEGAWGRGEEKISEV